MPAPHTLTATAALARIEAGELTARKLVESCLERIADLDGDFQAFVHVEPASALRAAADVDGGRRTGDLAGAPFVAKDIIDTHDMPTGYGSPIHTGARPFVDAAPVALARAAGAILLGKTVTTEFANLTPGPTRNPLSDDRTPGGSSSGSAAAVAAGMAPVAYGTQTTQSTIRPAAFCGVYGYCPTQGDFRLAGVREAAGSFDRLGLIARGLEDIDLFRNMLLRRPRRPFRPADAPPRIGFCRTHLWPSFEPALRDALEDAAKRLAAAGATVVDVELPPDFADLAEAHKWVSAYEFAQNFAFEIDRHWDEISPQLREGRIAAGLSCSFERYRDAQASLAAARARLPEIFANVDLLMTASAPGEAPVGLASTGSAAIGALFTPLYLPCVSLPAFKGPAAMPMGLQALAPMCADETLLAQAGWIEAKL